MIKKYKVLKDRVLRDEVMAKAGEIVYQQKNYDYGLASDDTRMTGVVHISVTKNSDGDYPGFTIPKSHLEEIEE